VSPSDPSLGLYVAHRDDLVEYASRLLNQDRSKAEDVVQEAWMRLSARHGQGAEIVNPLHYLYSIVRNRALDILSRATRETVADTALAPYDTIPHEAPSAEDVVIHRDMLRLLAEALAAARKDIVDTLKSFHETKADAPGLQAERLRVTLKRRWPVAVFKALLDQEIRAKTVVVDGAFLRLPGHSLKLGSRDEALWQKISADMTRDRFKPPRIRDFAQAYSVPETDTRRLLQRRAKLGRVIEVAPDHFFLRPVVAEMVAIVNGFGHEFSAAEFRDKLDNGRKLAIQILEFFDRHGITIRRGDLRRAVPQKAGQYGPPPTP